MLMQHMHGCWIRRLESTSYGEGLTSPPQNLNRVSFPAVIKSDIQSRNNVITAECFELRTLEGNAHWPECILAVTVSTDDESQCRDNDADPSSCCWQTLTFTAIRDEPAAKQQTTYAVTLQESCNLMKLRPFLNISAHDLLFYTVSFVSRVTTAWTRGFRARFERSV